MTDKQKIQVLTFALETLATASMGDMSYARQYEDEVKEIARAALIDAQNVSPQD